VIDAGHGGPKYPGAHYQGVYEKDLNLQVALRLGELIEQNLPEVKVVYTRKSDKQFSESLTKDLQARADIANNAGGDLFISIHTNAARSTAARGVETLIMGESSLEHRINDEVLFANNKEEFIDMSDQRTAAVVRAYIANLRFTYGEYSEAMGRLLSKSYKAAGRHVRGVKPQLLKVLYATNMPSVLTEIGFMSNPEELRYMNSDRGQREIARSIFAAVKEYVALVRSIQQTDDTTVSTPAENSTEEILSATDTAITSTSISEAQIASENQETKSNDDVLQQGYTIQILASGSQLKSSDSQFKSYRGKVVELLSTGRYRYKYCVGRYATQAEAKQSLAEVKQQFSDAYIIRFEGNEVAR
jgi:N-acetylmuramoyl-L-alanine amidase